MPDTADHRADMHRLATERRQAGKPIWAYRLTVHMPESLPFEKKRQRFADALENSAWFKAEGEEDSELWWAWDEIKDADDEDHFDLVLNAIYDMADYDRCWIQFDYSEEE